MKTTNGACGVGGCTLEVGHACVHYNALTDKTFTDDDMLRMRLRGVAIVKSLGGRWTSRHCGHDVSTTRKLRRCKLGVSVVDAVGQGWCSKHTHEAVVCPKCLATSERGCVCADAARLGIEL